MRSPLRSPVRKPKKKAKPKARPTGAKTSLGDYSTSAQSPGEQTSKQSNYKINISNAVPFEKIYEEEFKYLHNEDEEEKIE